MTVSHRAPGSPDALLRDALDRAATEAHRIALGVAGIDAAVGAALQATDAPAQSLQAADLLRQEIEGLARYLTQLAQDPRDPLGAATGLDLGAQATRLRGLPAIEPAVTDDLW